MKSFYIDKRPFIVLLFLEYKNALLLLVSFVLFFIAISSNNIPEGLSTQAYQTLIIFLLAIFLWVTNIIPLAITSLGIMGLLSTYNVLESGTVYSFFGNEAIFFIIGAFIISAGISTSGLSERMSYSVLSQYGNNPQKLVLSIFTLSACLSHIMPAHAVAALLLPILMDVSKKLKLQMGSILGKYMFFALAWGSVMGGIVTLLGGARNPLAIGILNETTNLNITFMEWYITVAPPIYTIMFIVGIYLKSKVKLSQRDTHLIDELLKEDTNRLGKIKFREIKASMILLITIFMWIFQSERFGIANISLISAALFFVLNVINWEDAKNQINWGAIFMYGGAIALGKSLVDTGLLTFFSENYLLTLDITFLGFIVVTLIISMFLTEGVSNAAVVVILLPVILEMAIHLGLDPKLGVYIVAIPSGLAFMLPMGSPPNAIAFSSGFIKPIEAIKTGLLFKIIAIIVVLFFALIYWPLLGLY
ncbi:sodium-dependent dicarboxylate transporter 2/3/5 [Natranaerovirga hydrolytica]|uniref:Sodium-dependent dicarboxylate transporter SdcS n=1 Tax=Natranaerovirga hydrolytica TaxID=680378 RepID=A0A4R1MPQ1_9FIRM|nr:DASS family sodium-coupled anion symporter [Natranaerovirga hydrolytica]TCK92479.1 sodium-dependent dicarboxylate transporter 2/3/5 [Natranaerovirga hydrolytica]